ncbi:bifunctional UDP-N-acetylglucosamine diphosphorylase/glucosamine-1-phosphate N-acetyltransferase GlmU [Arenibaculum pallidiluteum]|uniref:bifunctional UDP-N-acetylglucosamine diphosphorylase/glucosamine-1-phosphate N-acetyltransferase GlmU n=1 Tax=Arenibaculum pallidiluteum TaxID=2812559 RepID=UPI001A95ADB7|nr:bifunctional UDP-N-acetylglucosamine diphosphorylase/glucosamine-1-phosphate N-acetyltransferase GlmU [Arenibaculum pallidiluteum]
MTPAPTSPARPLAFIILAAGKGTRMRSEMPKVLHRVAGVPMVGHALAAARALEPERIVVVVGPGMPEVEATVAPHPTVVQHSQAGTGDAVRAARGALEGFFGDVIVLFGDTPLVTPATLGALRAARDAAEDPAVVVLGMRPRDPGAYGRLVANGRGELEAIVEYLDATEAQRAITLCNAGLMAFDGARMWQLLDAIGNANAKGEYYLTDAVTVARSRGFACRVVEAAEEEVVGVNSRADLAEAERLLQARLRRQAMEAGATLTDPGTVWFSADTRVGRDVVIGPNTFFGPGVEIGDRVEIRGFCHFEGVRIAAGAQIGPFARLRPGAEIGPDAHIGNFVEIKNARIEQGAKVNHLSYVGDARVGAKANIGAGTITCNYDGFLKSHTDIGAGAFIGSNTALVAPIAVGDGAIVGAGSVLTQDVPAQALAVARGRQRVIEDWAISFRKRKEAEKAARRK